MSSDGSAVVGGEHLRIYHEYLSYIFRKPEAPNPQQQLEMGYRDYLQVGFGLLSVWNFPEVMAPDETPRLRG